MRSTFGSFSLLASVVVAVVIFHVFGGASYEAYYALPGSRYRIEVSLSQMHPYLAEYNRELRVRSADRERRSELFPDTGGYARANLYRTPQSTFVVRTMGNHEYVIDGDSGDIVELPHMVQCGEGGPPDALFLGAFDFDGTRQWRFITAIEREERVILACDAEQSAALDALE